MNNISYNLPADQVARALAGVPLRGSTPFQRAQRQSLINRSFKGKHLLDYDALSSLLILLFIHDDLVNNVRLHRLIRNLCYHAPTRQWIIKALLEILEKTKESQSESIQSICSNSQEQLAKNNLPVKYVTIRFPECFCSLYSSLGSQ